MVLAAYFMSIKNVNGLVCIGIQTSQPFGWPAATAIMPSNLYNKRPALGFILVCVA